MADSNSQPARCPCGFWGSPQTLGLCSKCYKEKQKTETGGASQSVASAATSSNGSSIPAAALSKAISIATVEPHSSTSSSTNGSSRTDEETPKTEEGATGSEEKMTINDRTEEPSSSSSMQPPKEPSPGSKRDASEVESLDPDRPIQKNKKRCFKCNTKLELAIREIGRCRCDYVFCQMHRLPEQHDCIYDHKEKGRQEARDKMISPKKHMGTSLKRIDSDS